MKELNSENTAVAEGGALDVNYTTGYSRTGDKVTITNSHTTEKTSIEVEKVWSDNDNQDNVRPASVNVQLYKDNVAEGAVVTLNAANNWKKTWSNLEKNRGDRKSVV